MSPTLKGAFDADTDEAFDLGVSSALLEREAFDVADFAAAVVFFDAGFAADEDLDVFLAVVFFAGALLLAVFFVLAVLFLAVLVRVFFSATNHLWSRSGRQCTRPRCVQVAPHLRWFGVHSDGWNGCPSWLSRSR